LGEHDELIRAGAHPQMSVIKDAYAPSVTHFGPITPTFAARTVLDALIALILDVE